MTFSLQGKLAVITGGASGIGLSVSELFAKQGAIVAILDLANSASVAQEVATKTNGQCMGFDCDIVDQAAVEAVFDKISSQHRIDILVNNAGIGHVGDLLATDDEAMDKMYNVNVKGLFHTLKAGVGKMMADGKGGSVLNLASIASLIGIPDRFAYQMSKGAVITMTYSCAVDYVKHNIRCNCICPGRVHTPFVDGFLARNYPGTINRLVTFKLILTDSKEKEMFDKLSATQPIGRMGKPDEIASLALFLVSDEAKFINGAAVPIDGGQNKLLLSCL